MREKADSSDDRLDGTTAYRSKEYDPNAAANADVEHLGDRGEGIQVNNVKVKDGDKTVDLDAAIRRFESETQVRLRESTRQNYIIQVKHLFKSQGIDPTTLKRRDLANKKGRKLILDYLLFQEKQHKSRASWAPIMAELNTFWTFGFDIPWPVDTTRDIGRGKLPRVQRGLTPSNDIIQKWHNAMKSEKDVYLQLMWLLFAQHGPRPSTVANMKWRNIQYGPDNKPTAIYAQGDKEGFKTNAVVYTRLSPDVVEALQSWKDKAPTTLPEKYILPWRDSGGIVHPDKRHDRHTISIEFGRLRKKWNLPPLRAKDLRHWAATVAGRVNLSDPATSYLLGHDIGPKMRNIYDNPPLEDVWAEHAQKLPAGLLGTLDLNVQIIDTLPPAVIGLVRDFLDDIITLREFANRMDQIRIQRRQMVDLTL